MSQEMIDQVARAVLAAQEEQKAKRRAERERKKAEDAASGSRRKSYSIHLAIDKATHDTIKEYTENHGDGRSLNVICTAFILDGIRRATTGG